MDKCGRENNGCTKMVKADTKVVHGIKIANQRDY